MLQLKMGHGYLRWMLQAIALLCNMHGIDLYVKKYTVLMLLVHQVEITITHQLLHEF